jgi:CHC2 zinc finger
VFNDIHSKAIDRRGSHVAEPFVSFDEVKSRISIVDALQKLGYLDGLQEKGNQLVGLCPFHKEGKPSFKVTPARNIWHCFSGACGLGGDIIDLVCAAEHISTGHRNSDRRRAALLLQEWFGLTPAAPAKAKRAEDSISRERTEERAVDEQRNPDETGQQASAGPESTLPTVINPPLGFVLKNLDYEQAYTYAASRGIERATAEQFGLAGTHLRRDTVIPQWFQASKAAAASDGHAVHC